jgi:hypothetical protein
MVGRAARPDSPLMRSMPDAGRRAGIRNFTRNIMPGVGTLAQPLVNMLGDPERRAALGESARGFARDVQQIPSLDRPRIGRETADTIEGAVRGAAERIAAIRFTPCAAFQQTPGPGAGQRLAP